MSKLQDDFLPNFRRTGRAIAEFDQSSTAEAATYPGGYCAGLTVHWLALRPGGKNWPAKQASAEAVALSQAAAATYTKYLAGHAKALSDTSVIGAVGRGIFGGLGGIEGNDIVQLKGALNAVLGDVKMSIDGALEPVRWTSGEGRNFVHEVAVLGGGFYYVGIACDQGSHALGLNVVSKATDSACEFFDPNIGQLHFGDPDELKWSFDTLLRSYMKVLKFQFRSGYALRILPPQLKLAP